MEKFVVSARKYRPQNFNTVIGQSHITTTLKNAIRQNQLAHAFLFCGPRGVGKTTCARILAKTINCENRTSDTEACNTCNSCISFDNGTSMNIHELDAASNNSVDDIRSLVEQVRFAPQAGKYKVYIVDEVHMLSIAAFNAFLKTLEEPPPYAIFILATTEKHKILPTILSRCQIFDFKRITPDDTVHHLREICEKEHIEAQNAALHVIAMKSEGCLRDALSMLDKIVSFTNGKLEYANTLEHLNILDEAYYFKLIEMIKHQQLPDILLLFEEINQKGFEGDVFLDGFAEFIRNLLVSMDEKSVALLEVAEDFKATFLSTAKEMSMGWLLSALNVLTESSVQYKQARNKKLQVELTLIKLCYLQQALELVEEDGVSKKKIAHSNKVLAFRTIGPQPLPVTAPAGKVPVAAKTPAPKLYVETTTTKPVNTETKDVAPKPASPTLSLKKIKEKVQVQNKANAQQIPLTQESLQHHWEQFTQTLFTEKNAAQFHFKTAEVSPISDSMFQIKVTSGLQQTFIESEKVKWIDYFQQAYNNRKLTFQFLLEENETHNAPTEHVMGPRQQFQKLAEAYPLVALLKDELKLSLHY
ncbi:MAG TPA: DNA polymerase III subunit gamma/tau [Ferruginibacter sp.]|nr:DNA polymerase III subunit gamma/tau [Ferruginibacter sp.]HRO16673.1 DNA polymerase III subunit gamma/tau [Ferruginibacter sp.]HRQ19705.1 DNA polymerase III subunit gamma/tau [Ferruginibacter sp.]